jgi:hypothetical protein
VPDRGDVARHRLADRAPVEHQADPRLDLHGDHQRSGQQGRRLDVLQHGELQRRRRDLPQSNGCREYLTGTPFSVPIVLDATGTARTTMQASAASPPGTTLYFQADVTVPGVNPAGVLTSHLGIARLGTEPDLTAAEIQQFAPVVRIHPSEAYRPMSPDVFIENSRFRHHRGWQSDQGFHRVNSAWVTTDSHDAVYYGIPTNVLAAYALHADGKNRRPRDSNCGDSYNVFLQSAGRLTGPTAPNGVVPAY